MKGKPSRRKICSAKLVSCLSALDEVQNKLIYIVTGMFLVRRLVVLGCRPSPAAVNAFTDVIDNAVELIRRPDPRFPTPTEPR
jgi:hypothetical protein